MKETAVDIWIAELEFCAELRGFHRAQQTYPPKWLERRMAAAKQCLKFVAFEGEKP